MKDMTNEELLEAVLVGDVPADDARVQARSQADPDFRAELEGLQRLVSALDEDASQMRSALAAPEEPAPVLEQRRSWLWLMAGVAAAAALVALLSIERDREPDFPGRGELLGGSGNAVKLVDPWEGPGDATGLAFELEEGTKEVSSLLEFLLPGGGTLEFRFAGTRWNPTPEQTEQIPADAEWRLTVFDQADTLIGIYPPSGDS